MIPKNRDPETVRDGNEDERLLETEAYEAYEQITALLQGPQATSGEENLARNTAARLALLEEHFARICTVVGKLEQEVRLLKGEKPDEQW